jgi:hypothetical protein
MLEKGSRRSLESYIDGGQNMLAAGMIGVMVFIHDQRKVDVVDPDHFFRLTGVIWTQELMLGCYLEVESQAELNGGKLLQINILPRALG